MHIILGAGGPVANALTRELTSKDIPIRLVSRKPGQARKSKCHLAKSRPVKLR